MKILALESSATAASVALCQGEELIAQSFLHTGLTHSQTLLPMAQRLLADCGLTVRDLDLIAVAAGPGSFTGLRIGVAAAKGLAWAAQLPCASCSTLEAMAWSLAGFSGQVCAAMDARRHQVYNARFQVDGTAPRRLTPDRAIALEDLIEELRGCDTPQLVVGDGARLCYDALTAAGIPARLAPPNLRQQTAWGVARQALELARAGQTVPPEALVPVYHRLSQAERERLAREQQTPTTP
ncbi:MAG TPA: tRNA (adenosine(37)-N6)-threonylcarbamoyltransferase complex dimerization subunit type 1 TsaB [Candidatus Evtepia faecigallinarum]|nr:tRNA (adenosine(37)-N6)-threonylcarbamoyltransferase complex dimerization subunit type 1 TsaB [Candidatus Evtepia faecigallinarum]